MSTSETPRVTSEEALALAHVRRVKGFYVHLVQYCVTIAILCVANLLFSRYYFWAGWVALGWGLGLLFHGLRAFEKMPFLNAAWEKREVERYLGRKL